MNTILEASLASSSRMAQKPLMRGWSHALAALASLVLTVALC